jgi:hypothetical protein
MKYVTNQVGNLTVVTFVTPPDPTYSHRWLLFRSLTTT